MTEHPWSIRGVPPEVKNAAAMAANQQKQKLGTWLARAIMEAVKAQRKGNQVPALVVQPVRQRVDLADVKAAVGLLAQVAEATGQPPPEAVTRAAYARIREVLNPGRGTRGTTRPTQDYTVGTPPLPEEDQAVPDQGTPGQEQDPTTTPEDPTPEVATPAEADPVTATEDASTTPGEERTTPEPERTTRRARRTTPEPERTTPRAERATAGKKETTLRTPATRKKASRSRGDE